MADPNKEFLQKLLATFRTEAQEHLQDIVSNLVLLEQAAGEAREGLVERILKKLHTLKGAARAVNQGDLETLCHAMEGVFSALRMSPGTLPAEHFDLAHQAGSLIQALLNEPSGRVRNQASALAARLERMSRELMDAETAVAAAESAAQAEPATPRAPSGGGAVAQEPAESATPEVIRVEGKSLDAIRYQAEALLSVELGLQHHISDLLALADEIAEHREKQSQQTRDRKPEDGQFHGYLELRCRRLASALGRTRRNFVVMRSHLMDATLETALVPVSSALQQLPGLVRNLARSQGKEALLDIDGDAVQIDRRIVDTIREALIHLVTNAVDHGIETIERRLANGKPSAGTLRIRVAPRGGNRVAVMVEDDGAGMDVDGIVSAAAGLRRLDAGQIAAFSDRQKLNLALHAGVSTSAEVTRVSGRGVGLAIVAEKVAAIGGELSIENFPGKGCSFSLILPMRLATLRGLVLRIRGAPYVLPLAGLESVRALKSGDVQTVEGRETLLAGGRVVPAVRLGDMLRLGRAGKAGADERVAVIARAAGIVLALLVDEVLAEQEVLPKTLGKQLRRIPCISGATQLGDGSLVPILGLDDIARLALDGGGAAMSPGRRQDGAAESKSILVAEDSITSRLLLKHILESAGYRVETAVDGLDALSRLRHGEFAALVSDIEMPGMDGLALTEHVRADPKTAEMPVVLVTSLQSPAEKERGLHAGADAYVVKGAFDQDNLLATIKRLI